MDIEKTAQLIADGMACFAAIDSGRNIPEGKGVPLPEYAAGDMSFTVLSLDGGGPFDLSVSPQQGVPLQETVRQSLEAKMADRGPEPNDINLNPEI